MTIIIFSSSHVMVQTKLTGYVILNYLHLVLF